MLDLKPIKDRLSHIAPVPWRWTQDSDGCWSIKDADGWEVCEVNMTRGTAAENGMAIASAPSDIAALVAEVERLKIENDSQDLRICHLLDEADKRIDEDIRQRNVSTGRPAETVRNIDRLQAEVGRLRGAIEAHRTQCHTTYKVSQAWWDEDLWSVLDAEQA